MMRPETTATTHWRQHRWRCRYGLKKKVKSSRLSSASLPCTTASLNLRTGGKVGMIVPLHPPPPLQEVKAIVLFAGAVVGSEKQHHCALSHADNAPLNV